MCVWVKHQEAVMFEKFKRAQAGCRKPPFLYHIPNWSFPHSYDARESWKQIRSGEYWFRMEIAM